MEGFEGKVQFVWGVADLLRGDYRPAEYRGVILPLLVLRRLDAGLEPTKATVLETRARLEGRTNNPDRLLKRAAGQPFYNTSPLSFARLLDDPGSLPSSSTSRCARTTPPVPSTTGRRPATGCSSSSPRTPGSPARS